MSLVILRKGADCNLPEGVKAMDQENAQIQTTSGDEDTSLSEFLSRPSSMPTIGVTVRGPGYTDEDEARRVGERVLRWLTIFGKFLDLEILDAITIASDYDEVLREVTGNQLKKTDDGFAVGFGMTINNILEGTHKAHIILHAAPFILLDRQPDSPEGQLAINLLAHEASHVHDFALKYRSFPDIYIPSQDFLLGTLFKIALNCWEEYIASRLSAIWGVAPEIEPTFCSALESARQRGNTATIAYRSHGDTSFLVSQLAEIYGTVLKYGAYLSGHFDGLGKDMEEAAPTAFQLIQGTNYFAPIFFQFVGTLREMNSTYGEWGTLQVFDPTMSVVEDLLRAGGISFQKLPDGNYWVSVPYTQDTMPQALVSIPSL